MIRTEESVPRPDGSVMVFDIIRQPVFHPDGRRKGLVVIGRDITERKLAEDELRASEHRFTTVFMNNPVPLTLVAAAEGTFTAVNEAFLESTGFSREEVIGKTSSELGIFPDEKGYATMVKELQSHGQITGMELHAQRKDGEQSICRFTSRIIFMEGRPYILSTVVVVTGNRNCSSTA